MSGSMLETVLKHWDSRGSLECNVHLNFSRPVYTVQTGGEFASDKGRKYRGFCDHSLSAACSLFAVVQRRASLVCLMLSLWRSGG